MFLPTYTILKRLNGEKSQKLNFRSGNKFACSFKFTLNLLKVFISKQDILTGHLIQLDDF